MQTQTRFGVHKVHVKQKSTMRSRKRHSYVWGAITLQFTEEQWDNSNFTGQAAARNINVYAFKSRTLTYSEKTKSWTSFHSYVPENITSAGLDFVSFKAGKLYTHDDYNNPMSYYGVDYPSYIDIISNMGGDQVKILSWTALEPQKPSKLKVFANASLCNFEALDGPLRAHLGHS